MSLIRPEVARLLWQGREVFLGAGVALAGLWLIWLGGYLLVPFGAGVLALGLGWGLLALRRLRFAQSGDAPGVVEVDEGQVAYFGPALGGAISLPDLEEVRLLTLRGRRVWRLKQSDGQALLIPVEAAGAERLFDAFATLPGMETQTLVAALAPDAAPAGGRALAVASQTRVIWRRSAPRALR